MRLQGFIAALALMAVGLFSAAQAKPITYTLTGNLTGDIDFRPLTNAAFTWTITGDTTQLQKTQSGFFGVPAQVDSLVIAGVGLATPVDQLFAISGAPNFDTFAFGDTTGGGSGVGFAAPQLATYDGISSIGPIAVDSTGTFLIGTDKGTIFFVSGSNLIFQAVTAPNVPGVPEPLTLTLFGAGIGVMRRRRKALA